MGICFFSLFFDSECEKYLSREIIAMKFFIEMENDFKKPFHLGLRKLII